MLDRVAKTRSVRCAIYTRKSSEEGLEQEFNSLHAQREACEAYVASQRHEGWKALSNTYDDGGYSGGSMERPGLRRLLADIQAGLIDTVVVYKVDRLTRALGDFARMVEAFDANSVSFVSVTQAFNTTSSMGRLTLNVLLSFAQFEREVTGERIRDKIAASKKKGLWMGGFVPMGYAANGRTLAIVETDAAVIRRIYERFLALGSILRLKDELDRDRVTTRAFTSASNRNWGSRPFSIGHLRRILSNPIYVGAIAHQGERFAAQHQAIVATETFEAVQHLLASNKRERRLQINAAEPNLLAGLIVGADGQLFRSDHAKKSSRRYRYYVGGCQSEKTLRIPAGELEALVTKGIASHLCDQTWLLAALLPLDAAPELIGHLGREAATLAADLQHHERTRQRSAVLMLIDQILLHPDGLSVRLKPDPFGIAVLNHASDGDWSHDAATMEISARFVARGQELHLVIPPQTGAEPERRLDKPLIKALARAVTWYDDLVIGRASSIREIAEQENVSERYVAQLLPLALLKPDSIEATLDGLGSLAIASGDIAKGLDLPMAWEAQEQERWLARGGRYIRGQAALLMAPPRRSI